MNPRECDKGHENRAMNRTPLAAAQTALAADRAYADPALWITRVPDRDVLEQARRLEAEGPEGRSLWGLTFAVKDNIDIASLPTTAGCRDYAYTPAVSAPAVQLLLDAGALLLGKTNLDQFATGLVGVRSPYGIPRNVFSQSARYGTHDRRFLGRLGRRGGGGLVPLALGSDTNGSIRVPDRKSVV